MKHETKEWTVSIRKRTAAIASTALLVGGVGFATPAFAAEGERAPAAEQSKAAMHYSDADVVGLLVFGQGAIAKAYPDLATEVTGGRAMPVFSDEKIAEFTAELVAVDTNFSSVVTEGVQKNDPYAARAALKQLNADINTWYDAQHIKVQQLSAGSAIASPNDSWWIASNVAVATNIGGGWQAVVFTTVAALAEAVFIVAIVPAAVSYQFEYQSSDKIEIDGWAADLTTSL
jgi:SdpC family antimicrobial peptide